MRSCCKGCKPIVAMVLINFAFGVVNLLLKKVLDQGMNNLVIITYRQIVSTLFLTPIAYFLERKTRPKLTARILWYLFCSALVGATLTQYLFLIGLEYTSATFACAFLNMVPVFTFILSLIFRLEEVKIEGMHGRAKVLGTVICIGGAMVLTLYKGIQITHPHGRGGEIMGKNNNESEGGDRYRWAVGSVCTVAGCIMWSSWFIIQARIGKRYPFQYSSTALLSFFSALQSAVLTLITNRNLSMWVLKGKLQIITVTYSGMVGSALCYVGMSWCVKKRGPVFTAAFSPILQIFVAIFDVTILGEPIYLGSILGSVLVIGGLYILLWGKSKDGEDNHAKQPQPQPQPQPQDCIPLSQITTTTFK